eukprot:GFUD01126433.1.p1 GENE.GFUD01126433.1~~GFUD01126433.1.p1  ORF type:complete len:176 (-),score=37.42 GFUD01126433.1:176-703(-)
MYSNKKKSVELDIYQNPEDLEEEQNSKKEGIYYDDNIYDSLNQETKAKPEAFTIKISMTNVVLITLSFLLLLALIIATSVVLTYNVVKQNMEEENKEICGIQMCKDLCGKMSCQCRNDLTFQDKNGNTHGACKRADETGRVWCYTSGYGCSDAGESKRFPANTWSYLGCESDSDT